MTRLGRDRPAMDRRPARRDRELPLRNPPVGVSVAVSTPTGGLAGVVHDPMRGETFAGLRGRATADERVGHGPRAATDLRMAMVATGFGYDAEIRSRRGGRRRSDRPRPRHPAVRIGRPRHGVDGGRPLRRVLRAGRQALGRRRRRDPLPGVGLELRDMPATDTLPYGILVAPPALAGELHALVI